MDKLGLTYPGTFQDLVAMNSELKKANVAAFTQGGKDIYLWPVWFFMTYAQTTKNRSIESTISTLKGQTKFTDSAVIEALEAIFKFSKEGLFINGVN